MGDTFDSIMNRGVQLVQSAVKLDYDEKYREALTMYEDSMSYFYEAITKYSNTSQSKELELGISAYEKRINELRELLGVDPEPEFNGDAEDEDNKPQQSSQNNTSFQDVLTILKEAILLDGNHQFEEAIVIYRKALILFEQCLDTFSTLQQKQDAKARMQTYLERAETLEEYLDLLADEAAEQEVGGSLDNSSSQPIQTSLRHSNPHHHHHIDAELFEAVEHPPTNQELHTVMDISNNNNNNNNDNKESITPNNNNNNVPEQATRQIAYIEQSMSSMDEVIAERKRLLQQMRVSPAGTISPTLSTGSAPRVKDILNNLGPDAPSPQVPTPGYLVSNSSNPPSSVDNLKNGHQLPEDEQKHLTLTPAINTAYTPASAAFTAGMTHNPAIWSMSSRNGNNNIPPDSVDASVTAEVGRQALRSLEAEKIMNEEELKSLKDSAKVAEDAAIKAEARAQKAEEEIIQLNQQINNNNNNQSLSLKLDNMKVDEICAEAGRLIGRARLQGINDEDLLHWLGPVLPTKTSATVDNIVNTNSNQTIYQEPIKQRTLINLLMIILLIIIKLFIIIGLLLAAEWYLPSSWLQLTPNSYTSYRIAS